MTIICIPFASKIYIIFCFFSFLDEEDVERSKDCKPMILQLLYAFFTCLISLHLTLQCFFWTLQ